MEKQIIPLFIVILFCNVCHAFDYIPVPFHQAIKSKRMVCVGFVESIHITQKDEGRIKAKAKISVEKCLKGVHCPEQKIIYINYFVQNILGTIVPVDIELGKQVILAIDDNNNIQNYEFDSDINGGVDYCYICDNYPLSIMNYDREFVCSNAMIKNDIHNGLLWGDIEKIFSSHPITPAAKE